MQNNLSRAKNELKDGEYTLVLCNENEIIRSRKRGILPLVELYRTGRDFSSFSAADKVVGRAAAFMYALLGVSSIYAGCVSKPAIEVLNSEGITYEYEKCAERISNRDGTGLCPMETAVMEATSPDGAYTEILKKLDQLSVK